MKRILFLAVAIAITLFATAQGGNQPPKSPADSTTATLSSGTTVTIHYNSPSVRGRTIGTDLEPMEGKIWRAGANKATTFTFSKDVTIEGQALPAGKYAFFTVKNGDDWTIVFNKTWDQWGAYSHVPADDVLKATVKGQKAPSFSERMTFKAGADGKVSLLWGDYLVSFLVQ